MSTGRSMKFSMQMSTFLEKQSMRTQKRYMCSKEMLGNWGRIGGLVRDP